MPTQNNHISLREARDLYFDEMLGSCEGKQAAQIMSELNSILYKVIEAWGFKRKQSGRKITASDKECAETSMQNTQARRLRDGQTALNQAFETYNMSSSSCRTYGARFNAFVEWARHQDWWESKRSSCWDNQCCPERQPSKAPGRIRVTHRRGRYPRLRLLPEELPESLRAEFQLLHKYLCQTSFIGRVCDPVKKSTADSYIEDLEYLVAYFHRQKGVPLESLSLTLLLPVVTTDDLEELSPKQQKQRWKEVYAYVESWVFDYVDYIQKAHSSRSPRTPDRRLTALIRLGHFLYRGEVMHFDDYARIPIFSKIKDLKRHYTNQVKAWKQSKTTVADSMKKWPEVPEGKTALDVIREDLLETLRLWTRPRTSRGTIRDSPSGMAQSQQIYLQWMFVSDLPVQRSQVYRSLRISLACPVQRPADVPADGCYFPLPPQTVRCRKQSGEIADNYLYKVYTYRNKFYPEGIWLLEVRSYKTDKAYGMYTIPIVNHPFEDGTCTYDYIERYLCGHWIPISHPKRSVYTWWDAEAYGRRGRWVTKGWMEFEAVPQEPLDPDWPWGYFFVMPETGQPPNKNSFKQPFESASGHYLGCLITPHTMRNVWATWAFQIESLTFTQRESLAFAMGHSYETMYKIYRRIKEEERIDPIMEAIDQYLFGQLDVLICPPEGRASVQSIMSQFCELSPQEQEQVLGLIQEEVA